jgi:hypothetical protein
MNGLDSLRRKCPIQQGVQQVLQGISSNAVELQGNRTEDPCVLEA